MKRIILVAFAVALLAGGCKTYKSSKKSAAAPKTETNTETKVFSVPAPKSTIRENPTSDVMYETADKAVNGTPAAAPATAPVVVGKPVSIRSENFTLATEDQAAYGSKNFFVIVGSFKSAENADKFKKDLIQQGFKPIILNSETGLFRVCVDSFNDEAGARTRVQKIRTDFPKFADSWLLIKKK